MTIPAYILAGLAMVLGVVLLVFTEGNQSVATILITAGLGAAFGANVMQTNRKVQEAVKKADEAMEGTQTLRKDMLKKN